MKTTKIQNWYSTKAVITLKPEITLNPRTERDGSSREVWQKQLITPAESDMETLDEPDAALDIAL